MEGHGKNKGNQAHDIACTTICSNELHTVSVSDNAKRETVLSPGLLCHQVDRKCSCLICIGLTHCPENLLLI